MNFDSLTTTLKREASFTHADLESAKFIDRVVFDEGEDPTARIVQSILTGGSPLRTASDLATPGWTILIGNAGAGKSVVLKHAFTVAANSFSPNTPAPYLIDLDRDVGSSLDIGEAINCRYDESFDWALSSHEPGVALFLDSLDDRILSDSRRFVADLRRFLAKNKSRIASCMIACRRSVYDTSWFSTGPLAFCTRHVDHLSDHEYQQLISDPVERKAFRQACFDLGIADLLYTPFDGFYLARQYAQGNALPASRRECFQNRIADSLKGTDQDRIVGISPPLDRLLFLSRCLASVATFCGESHWTLQNVIDMLGQSREVQQSGSLNPNELRTLLQRVRRQLVLRFSDN